MKKLYFLVGAIFLMTNLVAQSTDFSKNIESQTSSLQSGTKPDQVVSKADATSLAELDFESFALGNAVGQSGYTNYNGTDADYQIVNDATQGQYLQIAASGGTSTTAQSRYYYGTSDEVSNGWLTRDPENNILRGKLKIFTGTSTNTTAGRGMSVVFGADYGIIGISWNANTKTFNGFLNLTLNSTGVTGGYNVSWTGAPTFSENTWYTVSYLYYYDTGVGKFIFPDGTVATWDENSNSTVSLVPYSDPAQPYFVAVTNLAAERSYGFDDYLLEATNEAALGTTNIVKGEISKVTVYPNPTVDVLKVTNTKKLISYKVYDMTGKLLLEGTPSVSEINVGKLPKGNYIVHLVTAENGYETRSFIKK